MSDYQDMPVFIVCGDSRETCTDPDKDYIEVISAEDARTASDIAMKKYGRGNQTIYSPENCPDVLWALVEEAVNDGYGSFTGADYKKAEEVYDW